ncbi:zinc transporter 1 [Lichtheimia corymbifera JMRC:FSU:9682]|uniref:Zinc transporter 1 n=1 Tax=Lichtheimia corymbifera JMRC:FSU:9682 TaxID=1263082 RepID=A0A068SCK5_9FUNG|nr:zinc transporter 1 [Lichtheimia corymbifera JMRC:FSU:9682]
MNDVLLVRETSNILLQASSIAIDDVRNDISQLKEVLSVHELHIWQLSDTKHIASLHVLLKSPSDYMAIASDLRKLLHRRGIHSATIQPEFLNDKSLSSSTSMISSRETYTDKTDTLSFKASESACLLRCEGDSCIENACCPLATNKSS